MPFVLFVIVDFAFCSPGHHASYADDAPLDIPRLQATDVDDRSCVIIVYDNNCCPFRIVLGPALALLGFLSGSIWKLDMSHS